MAEQFANGAQTSLSAGVNNVDGTITVVSATGFPTTGNFRILIKAETSYTDEICTVTGVSGTTFIITRASEAIRGVQAASIHNMGAEVIHVLTAGAINNLNSSIIDRTPNIPSAYDDEFNTNLSAWNQFGSLNITNVTDMESYWHVKRVGVSTNEINGILRGTPSMPFVVTCKLSEVWAATGNAYAGLVLSDSTPANFYTMGLVYASGYGGWNDIFRAWWSGLTTRGTSADSDGRNYPGFGLYPPFFKYLRLTVTSNTAISLQVSNTGVFWHTLVSGETTATGGGWTVAKAGLFVGNVNAAQTIEAYFDWIRFT